MAQAAGVHSALHQMTDDSLQTFSGVFAGFARLLRLRKQVCRLRKSVLAGSSLNSPVGDFMNIRFSF
jgi:predicted hotdog family 3-hydroxylacyl-ACP dehydratase